jgi:hypothetical protein
VRGSGTPTASGKDAMPETFDHEEGIALIRKLEVHCAAPLTARPDPRIWFGSISPSITHMTGPQLRLKNTT